MVGLAPVLHYLVQRNERLAALPKELRERWSAAYYTTAARNLWFNTELERVLARLHQNNVAVILLKGIALYDVLYPTPAVRPMGDIDLLVLESDVARVRTALEAIGYHFQPYEHGRKHHLVATTEDAMGVTLELHWHLIGMGYGYNRGYPIDMNAMWQRAVPVRVGKEQALTLSPEDTLLHLCLHQSYHYLAHLVGYLDIHQLVHVVGVDWNLVLVRAREYRLKTVLYYVLSFASTLLGTNVPPEVLEEFRPAPLKARLIEHLVSAEKALGFLQSPSEQDRYALGFLLMDNWHNVLLTAAWLIFFPDRHRVQARYPGATSTPRLLLYYPLHLLRLFRYGARLAVRMLQ